jgi:hypothetical protein
VGSEPLVSIGMLEGPEAYQLFRVADAMRLDDGRVAVVNAGSKEIRLYDRDGVFLGRWGGEGEGPGEFLDPSRIVRWPGDSVAVWDRRLRRLTVFDLDGTAGRSFVLPAAGDMNAPVFQDILADGRLVVTAPVFSGMPSAGGLRRTPVSVAVMTAGGDLAASLGTHPGREGVIRMTSSTIEIFVLPFARDLAVEAAGSRVVVAPTDRLELDLWSPDGVLSRIVRVEQSPRLLTDAEFDATVEYRVAQAPEEARAGLRTSWQEMPHSDTLPAFHGVVVSRDGDLWVEPYRLPQEEGPVGWTVLDPEGKMLGRVRVPGGLTVYEIGRDYLLARARDALEVEQVQMWPLRRREPGDAP